MQTKLLGDDLDFLAWGICPECGDSYNLVRHDDSHYECLCGWKFAILDDEVLASNEQLDETSVDVFA